MWTPKTLITLRKHAYSNIKKISLQKTENFQIMFFSYFCSKHRLWVLVRTASARRLYWVPQSMFLSRNKKNNVYPCKPQFYYIKVGFKWVITKTYLYNVDPLKPHFYIVKLGFTGVDIIFLISAQNIDCGYSLEPPRRGGSNEYPQSVFWTEIWKISEFFIWKFSFFGGKIFIIFE